MRLSSLAVVALALAGCGGSYHPYLPDGGRARVTCNQASLKVPVKVLDLSGNPLEGAQVEVSNAASGKGFVGATDVRGVIDITDLEVGEGLVNVKASFNDLKGPQQSVIFTCGECSCTASPQNLVVKLQ